MLLTVEKGIRGGIRHAIHRYAKANNKYMKDYYKIKNLKYWDVNNLYGWTMLQKHPVIKGYFKDTSQFNDYNKQSDEGYILEVDVQYPRKLHKLRNDLPFLPERMKIEKNEMLVTKFTL